MTKLRMVGMNLVQIFDKWNLFWFLRLKPLKTWRHKNSLHILMLYFSSLTIKNRPWQMSVMKTPNGIKKKCVFFCMWLLCKMFSIEHSLDTLPYIFLSKCYFRYASIIIKTLFIRVICPLVMYEYDCEWTPVFWTALQIYLVRAGLILYAVIFHSIISLSYPQRAQWGY